MAANVMILIDGKTGFTFCSAPQKVLWRSDRSDVDNIARTSPLQHLSENSDHQKDGGDMLS